LTIVTPLIYTGIQSIDPGKVSDDGFWQLLPVIESLGTFKHHSLANHSIA
jgi:hypothetical protein